MPNHDPPLPPIPPVDSFTRELANAGATPVDHLALLGGILAGCGDCIKVLDLDGRLQFMSEGGKRLMEVDDFSVLKGCPWPEFWDGQGNADASAAIQTALSGASARFQGPSNTAKGNARFWDVQVSPIFDADGKPAHILSISRDITLEWHAQERQRFLAQELQHRVKNTLATVISIANQSFRGELHKSPLGTFNERVITLDRMHDVLTAANWQHTSVRRVVETALQPHLVNADALRIEGPEIDLGPRQALALALATNELATNAIKYGSLAQPGGLVAITWSEETGAARAFHWTWTESGGPPVTPPNRTGFGSRVIRDLLANEFSGTTDIVYAPEGLVCRVRAPFANLGTAG